MVSFKWGKVQYSPLEENFEYFSEDLHLRELFYEAAGISIEMKIKKLQKD